MSGLSLPHCVVRPSVCRSFGRLPAGALTVYCAPSWHGRFPEFLLSRQRKRERARERRARDGEGENKQSIIFAAGSDICGFLMSSSYSVYLKYVLFPFLHVQ